MNTSLLLDEMERERFSFWLRGQIAGSRGIIEQVQKNLVGPVLEQVLRKERLELLAFEVVLRYISSGESVSISG